VRNLSAGQHRLKPGGIHTSAGGNYNAQWKAYIGKHAQATKQEVLRFLNKLEKELGID